MKVAKTILALAISALAACGGGGGGDGSVPAGTRFALSDPALQQVGGTLTFRLSGSDDYGDRATAVYSITRRPNTTFKGQPAQQLDQFLTFTWASTGETVAVSSTSFATLAGAYLGSVDSDGVQNTPDAGWNPLPADAEIGDFGTFGSETGSDGSRSTSSWRLDAHRGSSKLADLNYFDSFDTSTADNCDSQETHVIDVSGAIVDISVGVYCLDGSIELST